VALSADTTPERLSPVALPAINAPGSRQRGGVRSHLARLQRWMRRRELEHAERAVDHPFTLAASLYLDGVVVALEQLDTRSQPSDRRPRDPRQDA
jgi:hypothetical protein